MAIVNYNSLAALYNIRQKFEIRPTRNAFWFSFIFLFPFFLNNRFESHLEKLFFCPILIAQTWYAFQFWSFTFPPNIPQAAVDLKWRPCVQELVKESRQLVSVLMPTAGVVKQKVWFRERLKQKLLILFLQQFNGIWHAVATPRLDTGPSACDRSNPGDNETNSGVVHPKDSALVHEEGCGHILLRVREVK